MAYFIVGFLSFVAGCVLYDLYARKLKTWTVDELENLRKGLKDRL